MAPKHYDVIVLGAGAMGAATTMFLSQKGLKVLAIDRFTVPHAHGSSHGETRMTRTSYFELEAYVPLLRRSHQWWRKFNQINSQPLFEDVGVCYFGKKDCETLVGVRRSSEAHHISLESLSSDQSRSRFPAFRIPDSFETIFEPDAGFLWVDPSLRFFISQAQSCGAEFHFDERVLKWEPEGEAGVSVTTDRETYRADRLVITAGSWSSLFLKFSLPLIVRRQTLFWFQTEKKFSSSPCFAFDLGTSFVYGFPETTMGIKVADHKHGKNISSADSVDREVTEEDARTVVSAVKEYLPHLAPTPIRSAVCLYTMSPDSDFVIDRHPDTERVVFAAGFSGHGFKFAPVVGEILTELCLTGKTALPIDFLRLARFS